MNRLESRNEDLISAWFNTSNISRPSLPLEAFFEFSPGCLAVASNNEIFMKKITDRLRYYHRDRGEMKKAGREVIEAEIYYLDEPSVKDGICLPPSWDGIPIDLNSPGKCRIFKTRAGYHLKLDHREGFWNPNVGLASFSLGRDKTIKFIIAKISTAQQLEGGALRNEGGVDWHVITELVHMLFMRLFDIFYLHAASLIVKDKGVIMAGSSGSGKTTAALALNQRCAALLTDELTLVSTGSGDKTTISGILIESRLHSSGTGSRKDNLEKVNFSLPEKSIIEGIYKKVKPALILFMDLNKDNAPHHIIHKMDENEAFTELTSHVFDPFNSTRHKEVSDAVFQLVTECSVYRLELGRDLGQLPDVIAKLL